MTRRPVARVLAVVAAALLAGCGVPTESEHRPVDPPRGPFAGTASASPASQPATGTVAEPLYFVRGDALVAVVRRVGALPTVEGHVAQLEAGPTPGEAEAGLVSVLARSAAVVGVRLDGARAVVELGDTPQGGASRDLVLGLGQVVCTLTARTDVASVVFRHNGEPVGVPRGDGSLARGPLTARDYGELIAPA